MKIPEQTTSNTIANTHSLQLLTELGHVQYVYTEMDLFE